MSMTPYEHQICLLALKGKDEDAIAIALRVPLNKVDDALRTHGWPNVAKVQAAVEAYDGPAILPTAKPGYRDPGRVVPPTAPHHAPQPAPTRTTDSFTVQPTPIGPGALITRGKNSKRYNTRQMAEKIDRLVLGLAEQLKDEERLEAAKIRADSERQKVLDEVAAAKAAYDAALAKARGIRASKKGPAPTTRATSGGPQRAASQDRFLADHGITVRELKTWCAENDVDHPSAGRFMPQHVLEAYAAAHPIDQTA